MDGRRWVALATRDWKKGGLSAFPARCAGRAILAIQDTTVVKSEGGGGLYLHPTLVVDAEDGSIVGPALRGSSNARRDANHVARLMFEMFQERCELFLLKSCERG